MTARIFIIGIGPGNTEWIPPAVTDALLEANVIVGYKTYLDQIASIAPNVPRICSFMRQEKARASQAVEIATEGKTVAVISGGDAGIYGMAGIIFDVINEKDLAQEIEVSVYPGISALNSAAALLGAPLMNDFATISLSDYQISVPIIIERITAAAKAGFVLCVYNPKSSVRSYPFELACETLLSILPPETPVGIVCNAFRPAQQISIICLSELLTQPINMNTILIIGNRYTRIINGKMLTSRGTPA